MDDLINLSKVVILIVMVVVAFLAIDLSRRLARLTSPLATRLAQLHQDDSEIPELGDRLERIKTRYIALLCHVDQVDTAEFSAGEIETISLPFFSGQITAASAHELACSKPRGTS